MRSSLSVFAALLAAALAGCGGDGGPLPPPGDGGGDSTLQAQRVFPQLSFPGALVLATMPGNNSRIYVTAQSGRVFVFDNVADPATAQTFLDIQARVTQRGGEEGLLGFAFDPDFAGNGFFYVYYTPAAEPRRSRLARFRALSVTQADPASETVLLEFAQPFANHNGGGLAFGPDGMLYVASGDGGSSNDPQNNAQTLSNLLGKILRVRPQDGGVPADNPFAAAAPPTRGEIWAFGLRNPWRISFDRATGNLWAGDVGQGAREEIDRIVRGANYGWRVYEGTRSNINPTNRPLSDFTSPVYEYSSDSSTTNCSVTGGYVYRGSALPAFAGRYFFADFCSGRVWSMRQDGSNVVEAASVPSPSSFGEDAAGELYLTSLEGGIFKIVAR